MVGYAGAGKSTVMNAVRQIYESQGRHVIGGALAGKAAVGLEESSGIASRTLASWVANWDNDRRQIERGDVFVMDEAGMVASNQMQRFVTEIDKAGAKLILLGDARQLQPIEAGAAFRAIADDLGYIELTGVRRQRQDWMQEATIQFGSGATSEAIGQYISRDHIHLHKNAKIARSALISDWFNDWQAGGETIILAHRNVDVLALNELARDALKHVGGLREEHEFKTDRGEKFFAVGDRILFLEKDSRLGVQNGSFATVTEAEYGRLEAALDSGETVRFSQNTYSNIDYGYAATIHKSQGATVDNAYVYASKTMDAHLTYVAMTRHRENVNLYASSGAFSDLNELSKQLSRERMKITTLAYEDTADFIQSVREFSERRGIVSPTDFNEFFHRKLSGLRERFNAVVERFEAFGLRLENIFQPQIADTLETETVSTVIEPVAQVMPVTPVQSVNSQTAIASPSPDTALEISVPDLDIHVRQALHRLSHTYDHAEAAGTQRGRKKWSSSVEFELHEGSAAGDLTRFNSAINSMIPAATILAIGPRAEGPEWDGLEARLSDESIEELTEIWPLIHAGQKARHHNMNMELASVLMTDRKEELVVEQYEKHQAMFRSPETPLIGAVTEWNKDITETVTQRVRNDPDFVSMSNDFHKYVAKVWKEPDMVLSNLTNRFDHVDISPGQIGAAISAKPDSFGELLGHRNFLGRNDAARSEALAAVPYAVSSLQYFHEQYQALTNSHTVDETNFRELMTEPLDDLSPAATRLLGRLEQIPRENLAQSIKSADDQRAYSELKGFDREYTARFGSSGSSEVDRERLRSAIPNASNERVTQIENSFGRVRTVTHNMAFAERMQSHSQIQEQRLAHEQENSLSL